MCKTGTDSLDDLVRQAVAGTSTVVTGAQAAAARLGSRRKRLWELDSRALCPVLGVCLPLALLRKVVNKAVGGQAVADDYELHCGAVADCNYRSAVAEAVQRELDRRYALSLHKAARLKTTEALASWWEESLRSQDIAGAFWATLTHARCTAELAQRIEGQVHMLQHQVGAATRVDHDRLDALQREAGELAQELADTTQRAHRQSEAHARRVDLLEATVAQLRSQLSAKEAAAAALHALQAAAPGLQDRVELTHEVERLQQQRAEQQRALLQARHEAQRQRRRADELNEELQRRDALALQARMRVGDVRDVRDVADIDPPRVLADQLGERAVLCVGGRQASVPIYRQLIEGTGGRFLHHDGGDEDNPAKLDATLAAADLVICQTGCISHDAYWRVKDHCKRTGKRCIFVDSPSGSGFKRALMTLAPARAGDPA